MRDEGSRTLSGPNRVFVAVALAVGALASLIAEAVVAAGWRTPGYSYVDGYISDLASRDCGPFDGRTVCSPRWVVIDVAWIAEGFLVAAAAFVLARVLPPRSRMVVRVLGIAIAVGFVLFALFPKSASTEANGMIALYWTGAILVLVTGNVLAIAIGWSWRELRVSRTVGLAGVVLGGIGIVAAFATAGWLAIGVAERISTYSFLLWQLILAAALIFQAASGAGTVNRVSSEDTS